MSRKPDVVDAFDRDAATYGHRYESGDVEALAFVMRRRRVLQLLERRAPGVLVDVGCGPGVMVEDLRVRGWRYVGVDAAAGMLRESRRAHGDVALAQAGVEALPLAASCADAVLAMGVVEYLDDPGGAIRELGRVCRPGGIVIVTMPNRGSLYRLFTRAVYRPASAVVKRLLRGATEGGLGRREFHASEWRWRLAAAGLTLTDVVYYGFNVLPPPLDRLLAGPAIRASAIFERLAYRRAGALATAFILAATKR
jgi:SAM-dependent methyltransferase